MKNHRPSLIGGLAALLLATASFSVQAQLSDVTQPGDTIVPSSNNSPGSEGVANAIDNQPTKYLNFDRLNTGFTVTPSVGLSVVQCLTLTSANDAPERDPATYTLEGSYDGVTFTLISSNAVPAFTTRFQKVTIRFDNNTPYLQYRLIFPEVVGPGGNSMQIAEVELLGFLAPTDVTQPGDPIIPSSNNSPGSEGVANAIDNQPTKYLNFDIVNTGFTVTPSVGGTLVNGITLTSANDADDRDPANYILEGSLDGTTFFTISSGSVPDFPSRFYKNYIFFTNSIAFKSYRLTFPLTAGPSTCCMQISEVELLGVVADVPQDVTQPGDTIVGTSNNTPGSEGVANAIDNQPTKYLNFDRLNTGFTVTPGAGLTLVNGLTLTSANDAPERDPADYTLEGSYNGTDFVLISSGAVPAFTARFQKMTILFANKIPYLQYRLIFPNVVGPGGNSMQISEVELLGVLAPTDVTVPGDPIVASSNNSPGSEGVANAIDNQPTKYLNFDIVNTGFTVTPSVGDTIVSGLTLTSANDAPDRDPANYVLTGSNDGSNYVAIASGNVPLFPSRFYKNYIFFPDNTKSFKSYRLIFPLTAGPSTCCMQISEVEFLGVTPGVVNTNPVSTLIKRQPSDAPVLLGFTATFRVELTGPWKVQWYRDGQPIAGASTASYTTPATTAGDDGAVFKAVVQSPQGQQVSDEAMLSIFTPSTTESIGVSFQGSGANGAPTAILPQDVTGFHLQAYYNNLSGGSGGPVAATNSNNQVHPTITVSWTTSGEWGVGTGNQDPTQRLLNGMDTVFSTDTNAPQTITFSGVPAGTHSLLLYTVQVPLEFFNMNFVIETYNGDGSVKATQNRYIRPQNADEYNPSPGYLLVSATTAASRSVGNMMRFDGLQTDNGNIAIKMYSPGRAQPPNAEPIRGPGLNAFQLLLNAPPVGAPPVIVTQPVSANGIPGGLVTLSVEATGPNLAYQWQKNGQPIQGANSPEYTISNLNTNDAGNYNVAIENPAGRVVSRTVVVEILGSIEVSAGLINYFKFDDNAVSPPGDIGEIALNSAPGGQSGGIRGFFPTHEPGQIAQSLAFSASDMLYVLVTNYTKPGAAMTVSGWAASADGAWGPLINSWKPNQPIGSSGQFQIQAVLDTVASTVNLIGQIEVGPNKVAITTPIDGSFDALAPIFHHFAMTANGLTLSIYWDGNLVGSVDYLGTLNAGQFPWLAIGANIAATGDPIADPSTALSGGTFNGWLDDVAMWRRSLSAQEILAVFNAGKAGAGIPQVPPVLTPPVDITQSGSSITISWDPSLVGWALESTPSLNGTPVWTAVPGVVNNSITINNPSGNAFYRLKKQ